MDIKGKNIIITGGAKGIGRCLVSTLHSMGANICVLDIDPAALKLLSNDLPQVHCKTCDLTDIKQVEESINFFFKKFGELHILVNNAAIVYNSLLISLKGEIIKHDYSMWNKVISSDLSALFNVTVNTVEKMLQKRTRGLIINVSSISASGNAGQSAYSAAKAGVRAMTTSWAKELGVFGIRVACIAPGYTKTETTINSMNEKNLNEIVSKAPLGRLGTPEEIVSGIIFIIQNDFFNGKTLELDGGLVL